jgi:hypothetical protein
MSQPFKKYQVVRVTRERGTEVEGFILGLLGNGEVLVEIDGQAQVIAQEDIQS